jgi:TerB N-terminal domain
MARRRGKSTGGEALLVFFGLLAAAAVVAYRFIVDNAAAIGGIVLVGGCFYILFRVISKAGNKASSAKPPEFAATVRRSSGSEVNSRPHGSPARWIGAQQQAKFGRTVIVGGLFYSGDWLPVAAGATTQYAINPRLSSSAARADVEGSSMPYWPSYSEIRRLPVVRSSTG